MAAHIKKRAESSPAFTSADLKGFFQPQKSSRTSFSRRKAATASNPRIRRLSGTLQSGSGIRKPVAGLRSSGQRSSTKSILAVVAVCQLSAAFSPSVEAELVRGSSSGGGGRPKADMIATVPTASG
ncbi:hypothetical protein Vretifemale_18368 [Volvox reticuliferus]|uniref:Uncharacterized protein n=1 Tax=Volvox reticuliferus TaxID=1737510 RepID=A0A8J4CVI0_9CHLO|nr:hypothetical protein Vretifemale_18368 [Volvox reticuliferus]